MFLPSENCVLVGFFFCEILTTVSTLFVLSCLFSLFYPSPVSIYSLSPTIILSFPSLVAITPNSKRCGLGSLNFPKNRVCFLFLILCLVLSVSLYVSLSRVNSSKTRRDSVFMLWWTSQKSKCIDQLVLFLKIPPFMISDTFTVQ